MRNKKYFFLKTLSVVCLALIFNSAIAQKSDLKKPQKFVQNIIKKIENKEKWENDFIQVVEKKFKLTNGRFEIYYKYDRKPYSYNDTIIYVAFKSSNLQTLLNVENKIKQEMSYECYAKFYSYNLLDSLEVSRCVEIGFFPDFNFEIVVEMINGIIGNSVKSKVDEVVWYKNDYKISVIKSFSKPILEISFK